MDTKNLVNYTMNLHDTLRTTGHATIGGDAGSETRLAFRALAERLGCDVVDTGHVLKATMPRFMDGHESTERILVPVRSIDKGWVSDWDSDHEAEIMTIAATALRVAASARDHQYETGLAVFVVATEGMDLGETTEKRFASLLADFLGRLERFDD